MSPTAIGATDGRFAAYMLFIEASAGRLRNVSMMRSLRVHAVGGFIASFLFVCGAPIHAADTATIGQAEGDPAGVKCPVGYLAGFAIWYDNSMSGLQPYCVRMLPNGDWDGGAQIHLHIMMSDTLPGGQRLDMFCPRDSYVFGFKGQSHVYGIHSIMQLTLTCRNAKSGALTAIGTRNPAGVALTEWPSVQCNDDSMANGVIGRTKSNFTITQFGLSCARTPRTLVQPAGTAALDTPRIEAARRPLLAQNTQIAEASRTREQLSRSGKLDPKPAPPAAEVESTGPQVDPGTPVELNPQPLPPKAVEHATRTRTQDSSPQEQPAPVDPSGPVTLNPQPLPPKATKYATRTRTQGSNPQQPATVDPSADVTLNPQPLPPKTTVLKSRETTVLPSGPMQTTSASNRSANPQGQIEGTAGQRVTGAAAGAASQDIQTVELICQGGDSLRIESKGAKQNAGGGSSALMHIYFSPAFRNGQGDRYPAAGPEGKGLLASSCSYADREFTVGDPQAIFFETALHSAEAEVKRMQHDADPGRKPDARTVAETRPDEKTIPLYLSVPDHYWSFTAYRTNYGHFVATAHGPWKPRSATAISGTVGVEAERDSRTTIGRLLNIKVFPELGGVGFRFIARPNATPKIELGKEAPVVQANGFTAIVSPVTMRADRDNRNSNEQVTMYVGSSTAQRLKLEQGTKYHYVITVPDDGSVPMQQARGSFTTLAQTVRVRFTHIRVLSVKNHDDTGRLYFDFVVNPGEPTEKSDTTGGRLLEWAPGLRPLGKELVLTGDIERLRIVVRGEDRELVTGDLSLVGCLLPYDPEHDEYYFNSERPRTSDCVDTNVAKRELLLSSFPDFPGKPIDFVMSAMLGKHGSELTFDANVHIEGARPK